MTFSIVKAGISLCLLSAIVPWSAPVLPIQKTQARLIMIFVVDGLRPDSINAEDTPTLDRLRREGIHYLNAHSVFPSVTRVNAAAISTGTYPQRNGLVSNSMFHPGVYPNRPLNTAEWRDLMKLGSVSRDRLLFTRGLGERLAERGIRYAAVSSGSTGNALLLNHRAPSGGGLLVNGNFDPGKRVAFPDDVNAAILERFGPAPTAEGAPLVDWTDRVLREYVLPVHRPQVLIDWLTEPDGAQHRYGTGSKEARAALANSDRNIGLTLEKIVELGFGGSTDLFVLSDHGFSWHNYGVNLTQELVRAGLKAGVDSEDLVVASNGQSALLHFRQRDRRRIERAVRFLQRQQWVDVVFTRLKPPPPGTFSMEMIHGANPERGADVLLTLPWGSGADPLGRSGTHYTIAGNTGPLTGAGSGHGGMSPWSVRNTILLWGVDFKRSVATRLPASNVDIAPTVLSLLGVSGSDEMDGRILTEALIDGPDPEQVVAETQTHRAVAGVTGESFLQVTTVGKQRYVDKSWRRRLSTGRSSR